jgi:plasmid stabilization system protein ParE
MKKPVRLLPEARVEFNEATDWYERQRVGLGTKFVDRVREALGLITGAPERHAMAYLDIRKVLVPKFPYVVLYRDDADEVLVISVFHTSRDPSIWKSRV